ncbi:hypothetical protein MMC29_006509 [Sticta canariensis]|nr:hypothetical protein [Sticta canariensis]
MDSISELELLRQQLQEERRLLEEARRLREESDQRTQNAVREREDAVREKEAAERLTRRTALFEYLDAIHTNYSLTLRVQTDPRKATKGTASNPNGKWCPTNIKEWEEFPREQNAIWLQLQELDGKAKSSRVFPSMNVLQTNGSDNLRRKIASEADLVHYERSMVEDPVTNITHYFFEDSEIKENMGLHSGVVFENHPNTLVEDLENLQIDTSTNAPSLPKHTDQICVYQTQNGKLRPCYIVEYKAPHKLTIAHLEAGLHPMNPMEDIVNNPVIPAKEDSEEGADYYSTKVVAAVVTQTFSYMIDAGLEYAYICTGEALVFLRVERDDPTTVYYHLSIPNEEVGKSTGWEAESEGPDRLHLTTVGRVLVFTIQALPSEVRCPSWIKKAQEKLEKWEVDFDKVLAKIPDSVKKRIKARGSGGDSGSDPGSVYKPRQKHIPTDRSPVRLRSNQLKTLTSHGCNPDVIVKRKDERDDDEENGKDFYAVDSPCPPPRNQGTSRIPGASSRKQVGSSRNQAPSDRFTESYFRWYWNERTAQIQAMAYCTQRCLRGLLTGGLLDENCPNVETHRKRDSYHCLDQITFREQMRKQLSEDLDVDCLALDMQGSRGGMFKIRLTSHGYTVAAKGTVSAYVSALLHEAAVYKHLEAIQGIYIPVCLGNIDLCDALYYNRAGFVHMMFLSWGGEGIEDKASRSKALPHVPEQGAEALRAIHQLGVLHCDARPRNILWSKELKRVMIVDFERAEIRKSSSKQPLKLTSGNEQRKREAGGDLMGSQGEMRLNNKKVKAEEDDEVGSHAPKFQIRDEEDIENKVELATFDEPKDDEVGANAPKFRILDEEDIENKVELATFDAPKNQILDEVTENTANPKIAPPSDFRQEEWLMNYELRVLAL